MSEQANPPPEDFEDLYENAPFAYLVMEANGRILQVNTTLTEWYGAGRDRLIGARLHDLLTVGSRIFYEAHAAPLLGIQGLFDEVSLDLKTAGGAIVAISAAASLRQPSGSGPAIVRVAFFKMVERRRYEREIVSAHQATQAARLEAQGLLDSERETAVLREQFIAVLGHDLRNPLASISGGIRLLKRRPPEDRQTLLYEMLEASVVRMSGLIDNVLDFARGRLGAGIPVDQRTGVLLTPVLKQVIAEFRIGVAGHKIQSSIDLPRPVRCDPARIGQLVSNLVGNAVGHGAPDEPVVVIAGMSDDMLAISVANKGEPISAPAMERLFQPFFRGDVTRNQQGLGLGLHIASEIAKAHGGVLEVTSTPEETRFTFRMRLPKD
jgi:sigma-B regulation protein RsbU (phosphoserine phosphatase)